MTVNKKFDADSLKELFPELKAEENYVLVPLVHAAITSWQADINENREKYGVKDYKTLEDLGINSMVREHPTSILNADGKIMSLTIFYKDIEARDDDDFIWVKSSMYFTGDEDTIDTFIGKVSEFVGQQNLEYLMNGARERLKLESPSHLADRVNAFYTIPF